jgi:hypothetical protein
MVFVVQFQRTQNIFPCLLSNIMGLPDDIFRADTGLAFVIAAGLNVILYKDIIHALVFAVMFVLIFLVLKHILLG